MSQRQDVDMSLLDEIATDWKDNSYYDRAELSDWLVPFWGADSPFRKLFSQLDITSLVELACGHGRHSAQVIAETEFPTPSQMFLLDVNVENVDFCKNRFSSAPFVKVVKNNGYNFSPLQDGSVSAVFCYDAMVHFEYDCVISYIKDALRVLKGGGRGLFHHSNYVNSPGTKYIYNPHGRNFMSRELFSHIAQRVGFHVVDQVVLDWGTDGNPGDYRVANLDCLSLLEKPQAVSTTGDAISKRSAAWMLRGLWTKLNCLLK